MNVRRVTGLTAVVAGAVLLAACSGGGGKPAVPPHLPLYVNPSSAPATAAHQLDQQGNKGEAEVLQQVAAVPMAFWAAGQPGDVKAVARYAAAAAKAHQVGEVVLYNIPHRDLCGQFSSGGQTADSYKRWVASITNVINAAGGQMVVIVEPDALPDVLPPRIAQCNVTTAEVNARFQELRLAMWALSDSPNIHAYLDAGNPGMIGDPQSMASALIKAGITFGAGFSANVSNFYPTDYMAAWAHQLRWALQQAANNPAELGKLLHQAKIDVPVAQAQLALRQALAVIDVSRNGSGAPADPANWCNPPGRTLGQAPILAPWNQALQGYPDVAGLLRIKTPGVSDGSCNGGPAAGEFWPDYAVGLAKGGTP